jgi:hypothetical protein
MSATSRPHDNYRVAPVDEHGERTETFSWLSRVNRTFLKSQAATIRGLVLQRVSHVGTAWGGWPAFKPGVPGSGFRVQGSRAVAEPGTGNRPRGLARGPEPVEGEPGTLVVGARSLHGTPLIVSEFQTAPGGSSQSPKPKPTPPKQPLRLRRLEAQSRPCDYVMVVNNSQTEPAQAELTVRGREPKLHRVGWMNEEAEVLRGDGWQAAFAADSVAVRPWLAPGQMELYRAEMRDA